MILNTVIEKSRVVSHPRDGVFILYLDTTPPADIVVELDYGNSETFLRNVSLGVTMSDQGYSRYHMRFC